MLRGRVRSIASTPPAAGDIPWWAKSAGFLAVLPGLIAVVFLLALRIVIRVLVPKREKRNELGRLVGLFGGGFSPAPAGPSKGLLGMGAAGLVGYALGRRRNAPPEYSLLMVVASTGVVPCRYPTAPAALPVAIGDQIELFGRLYPDNTARAWRCRNLSTGVSHRARIVSSWVPFAAIASLALCLYVIAGILSAT
jgi:MYXO-CTERM domain-containing protein